MTSQERERIWLPALGITLIVGFCGFCIAAFYTKNALWLVGAVGCWALLARGR